MGCQYENPLFGAGGGAAQHQPVLADKIAASARKAPADCRVGNAGKVEVTACLASIIYCAVRAHLFAIPVPASRYDCQESGIHTATARSRVQSLRDVKIIWHMRPA